MKFSHTLLLLRGPLLVSSILLTLCYPALNHVPTETWIRLALMGMGLGLCVLDGIVFVKESVRSSLGRLVRSIVLDDVLRSIFDKDGWIAISVSTFLGNAAMYTLPTSPEQRVRIVESCLETEETEARTILTAPGGIIRLFPESYRTWLEESPPAPATEWKICSVEKGLQCEDHDDSDSSSNTTNGSSADFETEPSHYKRAAAVECEKASSLSGQDPRPRAVAYSSSAAADPSAVPATTSTARSPETAMASILHEIMSDGLKKMCHSIPERSTQIIGITASVALALHLKTSPRARRVFFGVVEGTTALTMATVAVGAFASLIAKHNLSDTRGHTISPLHILLPSRVKRLWSALQKLLLVQQHGDIRRWQGIVAMLILLAIGRLRNKRLSNLPATTQV